MLVFIKKGEYDRRLFIESCFDRYMEFVKGIKRESLVVSSGVNNKPYFKNYPEVRFSMSHSGDYVLLAMSHTEVGIDIEKIRELDYKALAERYYTGGEVAKADTLENYFKVWTAKEAYLKLNAEGLGGLTKYDVTAPLTYEGEKIVITEVNVFDGYAAAIAAPFQEIVFTDCFD